MAIEHDMKFFSYDTDSPSSALPILARMDKFSVDGIFEVEDGLQPIGYACFVFREGNTEDDDYIDALAFVNSGFLGKNSDRIPDLKSDLEGIAPSILKVSCKKVFSEIHGVPDL